MRKYNEETDSSIVDGAIRAAYMFGTGVISSVREQLLMNDIIPPKSIDSIVFIATQKIEKELEGD